MRGLGDKVGIVTGAGHGIGRATARRLADEGVRVCLADVDADAAAAVELEITSTGGTAFHIEADVADAGQCSTVVNATIHRYGRLDILVNNAGSAARDRSDEPLARWDQGLDVTLSSVYRMSVAALPHLREASTGAIINLSSIIGTRTWGIEEWYATAKSAIVGLTRAQAGAHGRAGVRVNAVCPGLISTRRTQALVDDEAKFDKVLAHQALQRVGEPEDVAGLVAFLASDDAAFITGEIITIDGGWSLN